MGKKSFQTFGRRTDYAVTPHGERFLVNMPVGDVRPSAVTVVLNWPAGP